MSHPIYDLFEAYFNAVDAAYVAFAKAEGPGGTDQDKALAYSVKDLRGRALNTLMMALAYEGIGSIAEGIEAFYKPTKNEPDRTNP